MGAAICCKRSHQDEEDGIELKENVSDLMAKLQAAKEENNRIIQNEKQQTIEYETKVKALQEEILRKTEERDSQLKEEMDRASNEEIKALKDKLEKTEIQHQKRLNDLKKEYEEQLAEMKEVHESVVEEMEVEIKMAKQEASNAREKYNLRLEQIVEEVKEIIVASESYLGEKFVDKEEILDDTLWKLKTIFMPTEPPEPPKPRQRGLSQPYINVGFGLKGNAGVGALEEITRTTEEEVNEEEYSSDDEESSEEEKKNVRNDLDLEEILENHLAKMNPPKRQLPPY